MEADFMAQLGGHEAHEEAEVQMFLLLHHNQLKCSVEAVAWLHCCLVDLVLKCFKSRVSCLFVCLKVLKCFNSRVLGSFWIKCVMSWIKCVK